jgi:hypothetical protein
VVVEDIQVTHEQVGPRTVKVDLDGMVPHRDHPKHIVSIDVHIIVVDLFKEAGRSNRTGIQVQSNKDESAPMPLAIRGDEFSLAETHVRLERQSRGGARRGVRSHPAAADVRQTHEAVEICDLGRIVDVGQRGGGVQRVMVDEDPEGLESRNPSWNRIRIDARRMFAVAIIIVGDRQLWAK